MPVDSAVRVQLTDATMAAIWRVINDDIEHEHGGGSKEQREAHKRDATRRLRDDLHDKWVQENGNDRSLAGFAYVQLRMLVAEGLATRECQCAKLHRHGCPHQGHRGLLFCNGHWEADVPLIDGTPLCGACHVGEFQKRSAEKPIPTEGVQMSEYSIPALLSALRESIKDSAQMVAEASTHNRETYERAHHLWLAQGTEAATGQQVVEDLATARDALTQAFNALKAAEDVTAQYIARLQS
jgi:hypothetical protein